MDKNVKVTIGIPIYNCEKFLFFAVNSVLKQTYSNFELILSDDGSTDGSLEIAKSINDSRIKIISDGENRGISYRLNEQISKARGKYFVRMDADDLMFPSRLEKQIAYLDSHPEIDVIGSQAIVIDNNNGIIGLRDSSIPRSFKDVLTKTIFIHPTVAGKTEWFRKFGYSNNLKGVEDFDLWIRSFNHSNFYKLNEPLLFYRDPLQIKLKTYRFRQEQFRKCLLSNRNLISNTNLVSYSIKSYYKTIVLQIAKIINLDSFILARRNNKLKENISIYYSHLKQLTT